MNSRTSEVQPFWLPAAIIAGGLAVLLLAPIGLFIAGRWVPAGIQFATLVAPQYVFPVEWLRQPDLAAGMEPGQTFRYRVGVTPVLFVWAAVVLTFGWFVRGLRMWQICGMAVLTIAVMTLALRLGLQLLGFRPNLTFP